MSGEFATIEGYAARYNEPDLNGDVIAPGAFAKTLKKRTAPVRMLYQHASETPIGRWTGFRDTAVGLVVAGEILMTLQKGREVVALIAGGAIDGLSIGYRTIRARKGETGKGRRILEAELWEVSVVTFPMAAGARITRIGSDGTDISRTLPANPGAFSPEAQIARAGSRVITGVRPGSGRRAFSSPLLNARHFASAVREAASILSVNGVDR